MRFNTNSAAARVSLQGITQGYQNTPLLHSVYYSCFPHRVSQESKPAGLFSHDPSLQCSYSSRKTTILEIQAATFTLVSCTTWERLQSSCWQWQSVFFLLIAVWAKRTVMAVAEMCPAAVISFPSNVLQHNLEWQLMYAIRQGVRFFTLQSISLKAGV